MDYTIQYTGKGDYIVRETMTTRERGRFSTEEEARAFVTAQRDRDDAAAVEREKRERDDIAYNASTPSLNEAQLTWQEWRTWFYGAMTTAARDTAQMKRAMGMKEAQYAGWPSFERQRDAMTEAEREDRAAAELYQRAVALDTRIKDARRARDTASLAEDLAETIAMIEDMRRFFPGTGIPSPKRGRGGTAPNTSLVLTEDELGFISEKFGGSKSAAIHAALAKLMTE